MTCSIKILLSYMSTFWRLRDLTCDLDVLLWCGNLVFTVCLSDIGGFWVNLTCPVREKYLFSIPNVNQSTNTLFTHSWGSTALYGSDAPSGVLRAADSLSPITQLSYYLLDSVSHIIPQFDRYYVSSVIVAALPEVWISAGGAAADDTSQIH